MSREQAGPRRPRRAGRARSDAERRRLAQAARERARPASSQRPVLWCDGGSRAGRAAYAYVLEDARGGLLAEEGSAVERASPAAAEYLALVAGIRRAGDLGVRGLEVRLDSQLAVAQLRGERTVRSAQIRPLWEDARRLAVAVGPVEYRWVPREENGRANRLVARALGLERNRYEGGATP